MQWMQWAGSVVDGGIDGAIEYGGKVTYNLEVDLMRAGVLPGAILQVRAESRYCCSTLFNTGTVAPNNTAAIVPVNYDDLDGNEAIALTNLSYVQFLSEKVGLTIGKLDTFGDGDANEFATGRGMTQFMNWNFNFAPQAVILPGSALGGGFNQPSTLCCEQNAGNPNDRQSPLFFHALNATTKRFQLLRKNHLIHALRLSVSILCCKGTKSAVLIRCFVKRPA